MNKGMRIQYFYIFFLYGAMIIFGVVTSYTDSLRLQAEIENRPELIQLADKIVSYISYAFGIIFFASIFIFIADYERIRIKGTSSERMNFSIKDVDRVEHWVAVGILKKVQILFSKRKNEKLFNDPELNMMFEKIKKNIENRHKTEYKIYEETQHNFNAKELKKRENEKIQEKEYHEINFNIKLSAEDIDFDQYPIEYFATRDLENFLKKEQFEYLKNKNKNKIISLNFGNTKQSNEKGLEEFLQLTEKDLEVLNLNYDINNQEKLDFKKIHEYIENSYDLFFPEEIKFFISKGIKTFADLKDTDLIELEKQFNHFFLKSKNRLVQKLQYYELRKKVKELIGEIVVKESKYTFSLSSDSMFKYIEIKTAKVKALYYDYRAYLVYFDEMLTLCTEVIEPEFLSSKEGKQKKYIAVNKILMFLPTTWDKTFEFSQRKVPFGGFNIKVPKVAEASFIFTSMLTHDVATLFCSNSEFHQNHIARQLTVDNQKMLDLERTALIEMNYKLHAKASRLVEKIKQRDEIINEFRRSKDEKFIQTLANFQKDKFQVQTRPPQKLSITSILIMIFIGIIGFLIGFMIDPNPNPEETEIVTTMTKILLFSNLNIW